VTRYGRVRLERQADLPEARNPPPGRTIRQPTTRKEPLDQQPAQLRAVHLDRDRRADQLAAPPQHRDRIGLAFLFPRLQQGLLGGPAGVPQGDRLPRVEPGALFGEAAGHAVGQRQVHVVAAHQQMIAYRKPPKHQLALLFRDPAERQVGRPAADVADQQPVADRQQPPPPLARGRQPRIDRRLRLFQQHQAPGQSGLQRGLAGQFPGAGVERGRHREHHVLLGGRRAGECRLPGRNQVFQIAARRLHGRNLRHLPRRVPRQDRPVAIDPAVAQPRLGSRDGPVGHFGPLSPGELADGRLAARLPRQIVRSPTHLVRGGQVDERRQRGPRLDRARRHQLRNRQQRDPRPIFLQRSICQHAVGRAQVDAQDVLCGHFSRR